MGISIGKTTSLRQILHPDPPKEKDLVGRAQLNANSPEYNAVIYAVHPLVTAGNHLIKGC